MPLRSGISRTGEFVLHSQIASFAHPSRRTFLASSVAGMLAASSLARAQAGASAPVKTGYAPVNGLKMYYEIHGTGEPLVLIHGGVVGITMFGPNVDALAKGRKVIAVELQGHGHTADIDRPMSVEAMADDIAALIKYLGLERADVMGYSLGGYVALQAVIQASAVGAQAGGGFGGVSAERNVSGGPDGVRPHERGNRRANEAVAPEQDVSGCELANALCEAGGDAAQRLRLALFMLYWLGVLPRARSGAEIGAIARCAATTGRHTITSSPHQEMIVMNWFGQGESRIHVEQSGNGDRAGAARLGRRASKSSPRCASRCPRADP